MSASETDRTVSSSFETTSNPPELLDSESIFNDSACGEPLVTQRVSLDFTPDDLDDDFVQRKCCAFWDYINSRPELKNINVVPDPDVYSNESESSVVPSHFSPQQPILSRNISKTAVDMLEFVEDKGLIDRAFEAKLPKSHCEIKRITSANELVAGISKAHHVDNRKGLQYKKLKKQTDVKTLPKLHTMCNQMHEWDMNHPKSMKPPGPPPMLPDDVKLIRY